MIDRYLAILEAEMMCKNLHNSIEVLSALKYVKQFSAEELYSMSAFKNDEIDRIVNYWKGIIIC